MNDFFVEPLKNWFGYTRRERRATTILLLIIMCVLILRYSIPEKNILQELSITNTDTVWSVKKLPVNLTTDGIKSPGAMPVKKGQNSNKPGVWKPGQEKRLLDINTCDSADLERLPGIGPVLSARIIKYRNLLGGFVKTDQLKEVYGLPPETFELISGRVFADSSAVKKININKADYKQLIRFPYFKKYEVSGILKYRELKGRIIGMGDLLENNLLSAETVGKVRPYLEFGE
ncbi:MAG: helix-hairpin-helix domain-containing protein [Bacteroidales bacterium]|nr:helix-hairpin-helix domain-containing protein [Bacteroidales bacterium]